MATNAENDDKQNIRELLDIYDDRIIPIGIGAKGNEDEIVDIVSNFCWTAQQFDQRNTETNKVTYSHNIPFCYAIERQQTIGSGAANILNGLLGHGQALYGVGAQAWQAAKGAVDLIKTNNLKIGSGEASTSRRGNSTTSPTSTPTPSLSTIRSNTFPNIIMPTPGNNQAQQGNNNGIAVIDADSKKESSLLDSALGIGNTLVTGAALLGAKLMGKNVSNVKKTPKEQSKGEQPQSQEGNVDTTRAQGGTATSSGGTETKDSGSQKSSYATLFSAFESTTNNLLKALKVFGNQFANTVDGRLKESNLDSSMFLKPWKWLYFTKQTNKKFVFPMLKANDLHKVTNQWGNGESAGKFAGIFDTVGDWLKAGSEIARGVRDFAYFFPKEGEAKSYENLEVEKAMGYQYSTNGGPDAKVEFVLFNTTKKDAWKKNFRFILLFALRNMPFRTSIYAYKTPLLYDIIIPGVKHLPMCYVASFDIEALGHVRNMVADNIIAEIAERALSTTTLVPVPEAWKIGITFKCMLPNTSNLVLNLASFPINVTTSDRGNYTEKVEGLDNPAIPRNQIMSQPVINSDLPIKGNMGMA